MPFEKWRCSFYFEGRNVYSGFGFRTNIRWESDCCSSLPKAGPVVSVSYPEITRINKLVISAVNSHVLKAVIVFTQVLCVGANTLATENTNTTLLPSAGPVG